MRLLFLMLTSVPLWRTKARKHTHYYVCVRMYICMYVFVAAFLLPLPFVRNYISNKFFAFHPRIMRSKTTNLHTLTHKFTTLYLCMFVFTAHFIYTLRRPLTAYSSPSSSHARETKHGRRYVLYLLECTIKRFQIGVAITSTHVHVHRSTASVSAANACLSVRGYSIAHSSLSVQIAENHRDGSTSASSSSTIVRW